MILRPVAGLDDALVRLDATEQLAEVCSVLSSRTRLAVLRSLVSSPEPLHINELARRVGVDASPVRTHLELLVKAGLAREVTAPAGRERKFVTTLSDVRLVLEGIHRPAAPEKARAGPKPRGVVKMEKRLADLDGRRAKLEEKARRARDELAAAWKAG